MSGFDQWKTACPKCKAKDALIVFQVTLSATGEVLNMRSSLNADGFEVPTDGRADTEDEKVRCVQCGEEFKLSELELDEEDEEENEEEEEEEEEEG